MSKKSNDAISRSDAALFVALAIVLATASAALGASFSYRPHLEKVVAHVAKPATVTVIDGVKTGGDSVANQLLAEHRCLSEVLYYEARGEGVSGQKAVAEVIFHRMNNGNYGHSICAVVYEGASHPGCQFSFTCNGDLTRRKENDAWREAEELAAQILTDQAWRKNATGGATNYHAASVNPVWAPTLEKTTQIGNHIFYRGSPRLSAS